jgi:hypothetical protein
MTGSPAGQLYAARILDRVADLPDRRQADRRSGWLAGCCSRLSTCSRAGFLRPSQAGGIDNPKAIDGWRDAVPHREPGAYYEGRRRPVIPTGGITVVLVKALVESRSALTCGGVMAGDHREPRGLE